MTRWVRLAGVALSAVALVYFVLHARNALAGENLARLLEPGPLLAGLALVGLYTLLVPVTGLAWARLLQGLGTPVSARLSTTLLAVTQFGKYLPGNVAHHLGRIVMARAHGMGTANTLLSMGYETLLILLACAHVGALTLMWSLPEAMASWPLAGYRMELLALVTLGALAGLWLAPGMARLLARKRGLDDEASASTPGWSTLLGCYCLYLANFILVGIGLFIVACVLDPSARAPSLLVLLTGAFACSWILGFLAPGAPAGLGVREAVLLFWLDGSLVASASVLLIVTLRLATTAGDLLNFAWGTFALNRMRPARQ